MPASLMLTLTYSLTIPILDSHRRLIALLGGTPRDVGAWKTVTDGAARLLLERIARIRLPEERLHHRRAQESFPALARGISHGGGQTQPGELHHNVANTQLTEELLVHEYFRRIAHFANHLFAMWAPALFAFYTVQMALLTAWKPMRRCFPGSVFAACTFNFGPHVGGHLILWDLRLVIRFPPGSTILLPSALIRHSNVAIQRHEHRCSFVQYTAGGLFRWIRNGFKTDEAWQATASAEQKAAREVERQGRWKEGLKMFSIIDDL
ncbi:hypothetical protein B0H12DRAFT_1201759 [Mycena haematopus]|nr:hypothetical protein B0H12DRAFT_1201759 [Mycena haematopus]